MRLFFLFIFSCFSFVARAEETLPDYTLPAYIDYSDFKSYVYGDPKVNAVGDMGLYMFNGALEIGSLVVYLKKTYNLEVAFETGTWHGNTTAFLAHYFNEVYTAEIDQSNFDSSSKLLKSYKNVSALFGSSEEILKRILPSLESKRVFFYLDAHWMSYWPLLDEIKAISQTHKDNCIIMIDDVQVPNDPSIAYDYWNGQNLNLNYVEPEIKKAFTDYTVHYAIPRDKTRRAKLIFIPRVWKD